jgi:hypothetical protein
VIPEVSSSYAGNCTEYTGDNVTVGRLGWAVTASQMLCNKKMRKILARAFMNQS